MRAFKRACGLLAVTFALAVGGTAVADSAVPQLPGTYAVGDAELAPGMMLHLLRHHGAGSIEVGTMRILGIRDDQVQLELLSGTARMKSGDWLQIDEAPVSPGQKSDAPRPGSPAR
jgi:hypothetical protein